MTRATQFFFRLLAAAFIALSAARPAAAAPCAGFTDVDSTDPFCASVAWIKNEGITVGCGNGTIYCPNDAVSRLAMAGFLKRFADATGDAATSQPYAHSLVATCFFSNICQANFPAVPTGKRLRLTNARAYFQGTNVAGVFVVNRNAINNPLLAFPVAPFDGGSYGMILAANQTIDLIFAAGESPVLEFGIAANQSGIIFNVNNKFGVTGYLVDVAP